MWQIGPYSIASRAVLAPMAGVSDQPFRQLCREFGAGLAASEMLTSDSRLWSSRKSSWRMAGMADEQAPRAVQIAGAEPYQMAEAARACVDRGAQIIDINMGCPAKKVCQRAAGSALLRDMPLVASILEAVVAAVPVPVTLKIRTGWCPDSRNALAVAQLAEKTGILALTVHGRTRACGYHAPAEYATIADLVAQVKIPVIANGDITTAQQARQVLDYTGAAAVMIGRAAQGQPWLFRDLLFDEKLFSEKLSSGMPLNGNADKIGSATPLPPLSIIEKRAVMLRHLSGIYTLYGEETGVKIARKHVGWYVQYQNVPENWRSLFNRLQTASQQEAAVRALLPIELPIELDTCEGMAA
jgi:tRNA-dihydrouridine synthase B